jgi:hypothetical protein
LRRITEDISDKNNDNENDILVATDSYDSNYGPTNARDLEGDSSTSLSQGTRK